jgi:hypothetical protein
MHKIKWQTFVYLSMFFGFLSFIIGSISGIARGGLELGFINKLSFFHQYFMIGGFFGTLITAERIVSLRNEKLNFIILVNALGAPFIILNPKISSIFFYSGGLILFAVYLYFLFRFKKEEFLILGLSAIFYILGFELYEKNRLLAIDFWSLFFIFTILGERYELIKNFKKISKISKYLIFATILLLPFIQKFYPLKGIILVGLSGVFIITDIALINLRKTEPFRFTAYCILTGYIWLTIYGLSFTIPNINYDLRIHSLLLGFVFSMVFAHARMILPSILKTTAKFLKIPNYIAFILFEASLIARFISYGKAAFTIFSFANFPSILLFFLINFLSMQRK